MNKAATIQARVDPETKSRAQQILSALGMPMSEAISVYLKQIIYHRGIPFAIELPNKLTEETLIKAEKGQELHRVSGLDELIQEIEA